MMPGKSNKTEKSLNHLVNICEDARAFYTDAIDQTDDPAMKRLFRHMADIRKGVIIDLRAHMRQKHMEVDEITETFGGRVNKFIGENAAKISGHVNETLVSYLEEAEDRCLHSFRQTANDNDLPADTRGLLLTELDSLHKTHDYMLELKEAMKYAS